MRRALVLLLLLAAGIAGILVVSRSDEPARASIVWMPRSPAAGHEGAIEGTEEAEALSAGDRTALIALEPDESTSGARMSSAGEPVAIVGRLLLVDRPAAGARIELRGPLRPGIERTGESRTSIARVHAESDGTFRVVVAVQDAGTYAFAARHAANAIESLLELEPGADRDLGQLYFPAPAWIVGRLEDPGQNLPDVETWVRARAAAKEPFVDSYVEPSSRITSVHADESLPCALVDPLSRTFLLTGIPSGRVELVLELPAFPELQVETIHVQAAQQNDVEFQYDGRNLKEAIWVRCEPAAELALIPGTSPSFDRARLRLLRDGEPLGKPLRYRGNYLFTRLDAGPHELVFDDPDYRDVHIGGLEPGRGVVLPLEGNAIVQLHVVDATTGESLTSYWAYLLSSAHRSSEELFTLHTTDRPPPANGVYAGLVPRWDRIVVGAPGNGRTRIELAELRSDAVLELEARLGVACRIEGTVSDVDGRAVAGADVELCAPSRESLERIVDQVHRYVTMGERAIALGAIEASLLERHWTKENTLGETIARCRTEANGRFSLEGIPQGTWILTTTHDAHTGTPRAIDVDGEDITELALVVQPAGRFKGKLRLPPSIDPERCAVRLERAGNASDLAARGVDGRTRPLRVVAANTAYSLDAAGRLSTPQLLAGQYSVELTLPDETTIDCGSIRVESGTISGGTIDVTKRLPARMELEVTLDGAPASRRHLLVLSSAQVETESVLRLDENGRLRSLASPPGEHFVLLLGDDSWTCHIERVELEPGRARRVRIEAAPVPGRLLVTSPGEAGVARPGEVRFGVEGLPAKSWRRKASDAAGVLELTLTPGRYGFRSSSDESEPPFWVEWTRDGPKPDTITLPAE